MAMGKKKITIVGVTSLVLVAMVVGTVVTVTRKNGGDNKQGDQGNNISASSKAIKSICEPTDHKDTCERTLNESAGNVTDPKELVQVAFKVAMKYLDDAKKNATTLRNDLEKDPMTKQALDNCEDLFICAMSDLDRTLKEMTNMDVIKIDEVLGNMKTWLSAALTYQDTCLDGFENTKGDGGKKMREFLRTSMELTENTLAMVTEVSSGISSTKFNRRLLSNDGFPTWVSSSGRSLLAANPKNIQADAVVAKDGSGKFKTIKEAIDSAPKKGNTKPFVIHIKEGVYTEKVQIPKTLTNCVMVGDGPLKTRITGRMNYAEGTQTFHTATVVVMGDNFIARDIGFENSAGAAKHQAVALRVSADFAVFHNCRMDGYQDTLYAHTYRQFYRDCVITGTIDFIFGDAAAVFQNCQILARKPLPNQFNAMTAQGRLTPRMPTGIVLQNCKLDMDPQFPYDPAQTKTYLGRPWKQYSRTIIMESDIGALIDPVGFTPWQGTFGLETCFYSEYNNRGAGSNKAHRVKWGGIKNIKKEVAERFTAGWFVSGQKWIPATGVPYNARFMMPTPADESGALALNQAGEWKSDYVKDDYVAKKGAGKQ